MALVQLPGPDAHEDCGQLAPTLESSAEIIRVNRRLQERLKEALHAAARAREQNLEQDACLRKLAARIGRTSSGVRQDPTLGNGQAMVEAQPSGTRRTSIHQYYRRVPSRFGWKPSTRPKKAVREKLPLSKQRPVVNADAEIRRLFQEKNCGSLHHDCPWSQAQGEVLKKELDDELRQKAFEQLYSQRNGGRAADRTANLKVFEDVSAEVKAASTVDLWERRKHQVDWDEVATRLKLRNVVPGCNGRTCYNQWVEFFDPRINHAPPLGRPFTKQEDLRLLQLVAEHEARDWSSIAEDLDTGRTAWGALCRYQQTLNPELHLSTWTEQDDRAALRVMQQQGSQGNWTAVAARLPPEMYKNDLGCSKRLCSVKDRVSEIGLPWSRLEIRQLTLAVEILGRGRWRAVARHVPNRSASHCMNRYEHYELKGLRRTRLVQCHKGHDMAQVSGESLKCSICHSGRILEAAAKTAASLWSCERCDFHVCSGCRSACEVTGDLEEWTGEEDDELVKALDLYGIGNWTFVRRHLPGRTSIECWRRFQALNPEGKADLYDKLMLARKRMLPAEFSSGRSVRQRYRSEVCAADFLLDYQEVPKSIQDTRPEMTYSVLTTGNQEWDRSLKRVNSRRKHSARTQLQSLQDVQRAAALEDRSTVLLKPKRKRGDSTSSKHIKPGDSSAKGRCTRRACAPQICS